MFRGVKPSGRRLIILQSGESGAERFGKFGPKAVNCCFDPEYFYVLTFYIFLSPGKLATNLNTHMKVPFLQQNWSEISLSSERIFSVWKKAVKICSTISELYASLSNPTKHLWLRLSVFTFTVSCWGMF